MWGPLSWFKTPITRVMAHINSNVRNISITFMKSLPTNIARRHHLSKPGFIHAQRFVQYIPWSIMVYRYFPSKVSGLMYFSSYQIVNIFAKIDGKLWCSFPSASFFFEASEFSSIFSPKKLKGTMWGPPVIAWFIFAPVTSSLFAYHKP